MCERPSDQQNNRPAEHMRNWQFWDREGTAPDGGVRVVESLTRPTSFPWPQGDTSAAANEGSRYRRRQCTQLLQAASGVGKALMPRIIAYSATSRVERGAPCYRERPLGLRLPSKRASPFFGGYPSSNRTCSFPAYGSPCGTGFISFAPLRPLAPFHIDSDGCSSIWTSGFRRAAT